MKNEKLEPVDKIRVCLSVKEWELLVEETFIDDDLTNSVVMEGNKKYIDWSADDIDCVLGYVAEAANHVENAQVVKLLDKLFDKIEKFEIKLSGKTVPRKSAKIVEFIPDWAKADARLRTTPYSEEELDTLTKGTIGSIEDLDIWKNLVAMVGLEDATQTIRMALKDGQGISSKKRGH